MFSRRRSANPAKLSTASGMDEPLVPQDAPPLRQGINTTSNSTSCSESHSISPQKADPYRHHLQQSESKVRPVSSGMKYPPPIENKAQMPKRPRTSHILDRVSSLFNSPPGRHGARSNETDKVVATETEDRDDISVGSSINKLKYMSKLIKPMSRNTPKKKHTPPPIITTSSSSSLSVSSSFLPFRSLTYSRSKLTQQILSTLAENSPAEPSRTPCTPRGFWYNDESDEEDIRAPSGLGDRASISSSPSSPYGGRYPWEAGPELVREQPLKRGNVNEGTTSNEEKRDLKDTFRFPNRSLDHVASDNETDQHPAGTANLTRTGRRPRALSSPAMSSRALLISKAREKLEMATEFQRLTARRLDVNRPNGIAGEQGGQDRSKEGLQENIGMKEVEDAEKELQCETTKDVERDRNELGGMKHTSGREENIVSTTQQDGEQHPFFNQPSEAEQNQYDTGRERDRIMSFSLVHMFPEPPSTRPSSDLTHMLAASSPLTPNAAPASTTPPVSPSASRRFSSDSMMTTASTATMTSLGVNFSIINGPFSLHALSSPDSPLIHSPVLNSTLPNGIPYTPPNGSLLSLPSPTSLFMVTNLSTPARTSATLTFQSFSPSPYPFSPQLPHEVLSLALSFLPDRKDLASVACVSKEYATAVRALLYSTVNLNSLEEGVEDGPIRVRQLLRLLVKRNDLTALVTKFVCHEWPEWFPSPPYASQHEPPNVCCEESEELEDTFLSATLVLALSRMTGLREIVLPSYHPFLFTSEKGLTWSGLKSAEFRNVTMDDEEAKEMFAWLEGMNGLERLLFPMLVEKTSSAKKASNESIKPAQQTPKSPKRQSTQKRCNSCLSSVHWNAKTVNLRDSTSVSARPMSLPICDSGCKGGQVPETQPHGEPGLIQFGPEWVHPLAKFAPSRTFLPELKVLHATPTIVSLLAVSSPEQPQLEGDNLPRPLVDVTINIDMTLYTGLRPTALVQGLHGPKRFGLRFGERVDKRTVEKILMSVGTGLGNVLEELQIELIGAWAAGSDETLYKILDTSLPRYPGLRRLNLRYPKEDDERPPLPLTAIEETRLGQWAKNCPQLERVELLSRSAWRRSLIMSFDAMPEQMSRRSMLCSLL
ncbi:hypothetical protein APHAL10511_005708 [Amanita phalloides]|nr:hypothetical protein APHAL10511_005708 [Amanita phalloides]